MAGSPVVAAAVAAVAVAARAEPPYDEEVHDVAYNFGVGREAPAFALVAADGGEIDLKRYRGDWHVVLAFVSASDADVEQQLAALDEAAGVLWGLRGQVLVVCDAGFEEVSRLVEATGGLSYPILTDGGAVAQRYGAARADGRCRCTAFLVDRAGKIVWSGEGASAFEASALFTVFRELVR